MSLSLSPVAELMPRQALEPVVLCREIRRTVSVHFPHESAGLPVLRRKRRERVSECVVGPPPVERPAAVLAERFRTR